MILTSFRLQLVLFLLAGASSAQTALMPAPLTLDEAIAKATSNEPAFAAAQAEQRALALEKTNAKAALLPTATYHNQAVYTQPNGVAASRIGQTANSDSPIFIANNAIREYASQGVFDEKIGFTQIGAIKLANANAARAEAELEVARRGLVATVVGLFYGYSAAAAKISIAQEAQTEANRFLDVTQKRENARESAHSDVLKAQLQQQQRSRELEDAKLASEKAYLELGVLLNPDPSAPYSLDTAAPIPAMPDRATVQELAQKNNPELRSALASLQLSQATTYASRAALAPDLALNYTYGIDATNIGVNGPDGIRNLGYSMSATLDIPVWDWFSTERKIKASRYRENAARTAFSAAQRRLAANLLEFYAEADAANRQLASLEESEKTARETLRLVNLRYVDGESTVLDVVDAQNTLISTQSALVDGQVRYQTALANLQTLTGKF